ncbi:TPA: DUF4159 domain-containing protein [Candidatus Poribacteria bacterium]|nr:DUF4159 domain-containing protein [Candidatus Poribacteria bacterium]HIO49785.1 DUF4159 domain-containing protein [Candidatus Poribacteria bacterium]HIO81310.1 DUF4159 domain-containing protein [Candidatus Poribacteria bacterium]
MKITVQFRADSSELLKAIQGLQSKAGAHNRLNQLSHVDFRTLENNRVEISARNILADMKILADAEIVSSGSSKIPILWFSDIIRQSDSESIGIESTANNQIQVTCGNQVHTFSAIDQQSSAFILPTNWLNKRNWKRTSPAFTISFIVHAIFVIYIALTITTKLPTESISIEMVNVPLPTIRKIKKPIVNRVQRRVTLKPSLRKTPQPQVQITAPTQVAETAKLSTAPIHRNFSRNPELPNRIPDPMSTTAKLPANPREYVLKRSSGSPTKVKSGSGIETGRFRAQSQGRKDSKGISSIIETTGATDSADLSSSKFQDLIRVPDNQLGAIIVGQGKDVQGHIRLIRLKHSLSDWWQDPTAIPSFMTWLGDHTLLKADMKFEGGALPLTDRKILDAPIIFMTGHDKDITVGRNMVKGGPLTDGFSSEERAALREYLVERGGMLYFDDCGFNGLFARQVEFELSQILPEYPLKHIQYNHEIYKVYYELSVPPNGGDVYWGSENKPRASKFRFHKGITIGRRLAVVYNRKDYMCAMETAEISSRTMLRMRRSADVHRFMTNLLFYTMKYGGNVDRSQYKN